MLTRFAIIALATMLAFPVALFLVLFPIAIAATAATAAGLAIAAPIVTAAGCICALPVAYRIAASFEAMAR